MLINESIHECFLFVWIYRVFVSVNCWFKYPMSQNVFCAILKLACSLQCVCLVCSTSTRSTKVLLHSLSEWVDSQCQENDVFVWEFMSDVFLCDLHNLFVFALFAPCYSLHCFVCTRLSLQSLSKQRQWWNPLASHYNHFYNSMGG